MHESKRTSCWCLAIIVLIAAIASSFLSQAALAQPRHALVVGIDTYVHVAPLQKARNHARSVADALERAGFQTDLHLDVDENGLLAALTGFSARLDPGDEALFYFAGHGVDNESRNYLLPAAVPSVPPGQELMVMRRAMPVDDVIDTLQRGGARLSLLILDACRDNPFETRGTHARPR